MNRDYLPPSLMHRQNSSTAMDSNDTVMMATTSGGGGGVPSANTNGSHVQQHQMYGGYHHHQGINLLPQQQLPQAGSLANVMSPLLNAANGPAATTTRRSNSFTGGVPVVGHPLYTQMLPPVAPQMAHQSSAYTPQIAQGGQANSSLGGHLTSTGGGLAQQPIRVRRMDQFSRTCKLPTVQEVGKLHLTESSTS